MAQTHKRLFLFQSPVLIVSISRQPLPVSDSEIQALSILWLRIVTMLICVSTAKEDDCIGPHMGDPYELGSKAVSLPLARAQSHDLL